MSIILKDVIEHELLSKETINILPNGGYCTCGTELEFTDSLSQVYCPSKECYVKMAARVAHLVRSIGATGWDSEIAIKVCESFKLKSPFQLLLLKGSSLDGVDNFEELIDGVCEKANNSLELWELVKLIGIDSLEKVAYKLFYGYNSIEEAYNDIKLYQVPFIADRLGLKNADTGVIAVNIYNTLLEYETELLFGEKKFKVYKATGDKIQIAITGYINGFTNKSSFINYINLRFNGKVNVMLMNSVVSNIDVLITDGDTSSRKYRTACKLNEQAKQRARDNGDESWHTIMVTTSDEYLDYLESKYETDCNSI